MAERLVAPDGREFLVGTAVEREQLLAQGYKPKSDKPTVKPAVAEPVKDEAPAEVDVDKPARRTVK